jgi:hypothetical protein
MNQLELPAPRPSLKLPLTRDHLSRSVELFDVNQSRHSVLFGEAFDQSLLVLEYTALEVVGRAYVKHSRLAAHDVNVIAHRPSRVGDRARSFTSFRMTMYSGAERFSANY